MNFFDKLVTKWEMAKLIRDEKGETEAIKLVIVVFLVAILASALIPTSVDSLVSGRNASWTTSTLSTYDAIQILLLVAVIAVVAGIAMKAI